MAHSYFSPRPPRQHSADEELAGDLEQSIFIFPSPRIGSDPPSPLSITTDVSFPSTTTTTTTTAERRGRRTSSVSGVSEWATISGRSVSVDTALRSPLIEVWEMSDDAEDENSAAEEAPESTPWNAPGRQQRRYPLGRYPFPNTFTFSDGRFQLRARKESFISSIDGQNSYTSLSTPDTTTPKHAASRLPLLAFFSSLLAVEDTTLHLLTRPSHPHASPLFPGARLQPIEDNDTLLDEKRALFASPTSLKAGIEIATDPSVSLDSVFALSLPSLPFAYIWDFVAGAALASVPRKGRLCARASA